jgi:hypothetical protein
MRRWVDWQFFIVALSRLRYAAHYAKRVPAVSAEMSEAIDAFTRALPGLRTMRNVAEHTDEYASDRGRANVERGELQVGPFDENNYECLVYRLNTDDAFNVAEQLCIAVQGAREWKVQGSPAGNRACDHKSRSGAAKPWLPGR